MLDALVLRLQEFSSELAGLDAVFELDTKGDPDETYQLIIKGEHIEWLTGTPLVATCTIQMTRDHLYNLVDGSLDPTTAFLTGKIKIQGDRSQLIILQSILRRRFRNLPYLDLRD